MGAMGSAGSAGAQQRPTPPPPTLGATDPPPPPPEVPKPPDGKWLTDELGRQYFTIQIPKQEGEYRWLDDKTIVLRYGMRHEVTSHDDMTFTVKIFNTEGTAMSEPAKKVPTPEELAGAAATYAPLAADGDLLAFVPFAEGLPASGQWRNGFKIADMNGDGHLDIVHGPERKGARRRPNVFLGDGKGSWRRWEEVQFPPLGYDYGDVAVADFNGDGRLDLALAVHLRGVLVLVADGPASFKEWGQGVFFHIPGRDTASRGLTSRTIEAADWNGDGRPDLVVLGEGPRMTVARTIEGKPEINASHGYGVLVYLNRGDGTWEVKDERSNPRPIFGDDLEVADFNADGRLDLLLGLNVLGSKQLLRLGGEGGAWTVAELPGLRPAILAGGVHVADLDGDGRQDLAIGYMANELGVWRTGVDLFYARGTGKTRQSREPRKDTEWERRTLYAEEGRRGIFALDGGDLDGDGRTDLAALTGDGEVWVFLGRPGGAFLREASSELPAPTGCRGYDVKLADLDGDGRDELVAAFAGEASALFAPDKCRHGGSLQAWKNGPLPEAAAAAAEPGGPGDTGDIGDVGDIGDIGGR
jgi:hypothetical protein